MNLNLLNYSISGEFIFDTRVFTRQLKFLIGKCVGASTIRSRLFKKMSSPVAQVASLCGILITRGMVGLYQEGMGVLFVLMKLKKSTNRIIIK